MPSNHQTRLNLSLIFKFVQLIAKNKLDKVDLERIEGLEMELSSLDEVNLDMHSTLFGYYLDIHSDWIILRRK